jgi:predicted metalloprotease with PDZ domain
MPRTILHALSALLLLCSAAGAFAQAPPAAPAPPAHDGLGNRYTVTIDAKATRADVEADLWLPSASLAMFGVVTGGDLKNGQADLLRGLDVRDAGGRPLAIKDLGEGDFEVSGQGRVRVRYHVLLEHHRHRWPAGLEEVSYHTPDGLMATGYSLLLAPGDGMHGDIRVRFALPDGWRAFTPWDPEAGAAGAFRVASRRELLNNALFFGTAAPDVVDLGGMEVTLLLGPRHRPARDLFVDLLRAQMRSYREIFGGPPLGRRYLVIVNEGLDDGGAFASSFSQFISGEANAENRLGWGYVMSHELLHFWNGLSLVRKDSREEWFNEGVTDYLTVVTQARNGLLDERRLIWRLENITRRYLFARIGQRLGMSVRDAGADKQPNRELIYGGGALAGLALDVHLRKASDGRVGLPDLMRSLYAEFGKPGLTYALEDITRHAAAIGGGDVGPLLADAVASTAWFDATPWLADLGLRMNNYLFDESYIRRDRDATPAQLARFTAVFGQPPPQPEGVQALR